MYNHHNFDYYMARMERKQMEKAYNTKVFRQFVKTTSSKRRKK